MAYSASSFLSTFFIFLASQSLNKFDSDLEYMQKSIIFTGFDSYICIT